MNNFLKLLSIFFTISFLASCSKSKDPEYVPLRDYNVQYAADLDSIDKYINTHHIDFDSNYNVTFSTTTVASMNIRNQTNIILKDTMVYQRYTATDSINYKVYFIKFREGTQKRPTQVDSIHVSYRGITLADDQFDNAQTPVWFKIQDVVSGWSHILPNFHTGTYVASTGSNPTTFDNFGAGVMFLPSGLAYYSNIAGIIPSYSPIIFSFKLYELQYRDHDGDGILSKDERSTSGINPLTDWTKNPLKYDSDGDGYANMYDIDDDGDNFLTKTETLKIASDVTVTATRLHYPFSPTTTEPKGIPNCGNTDYTSTTRLRKHLDKNCH